MAVGIMVINLSLQLNACQSIKSNQMYDQVQVKTTKNTEKLVRRKIVLEDGRVLAEEDPHIVVDTVQDTRTRKVIFSIFT